MHQKIKSSGNEKPAAILRVFLQGLVDADDINIEGKPWSVFKVRSYTKLCYLMRVNSECARQAGAANKGRI